MSLQFAELTEKLIPISDFSQVQTAEVASCVMSVSQE